MATHQCRHFHHVPSLAPKTSKLSNNTTTTRKMNEKKHKRKGEEKQTVLVLDKHREDIKIEGEKEKRDTNTYKYKGY